MSDAIGWSIPQFAAAYTAGRTVTDVVTRILDALDTAPAGVLIGAPLREEALVQAAALDARDQRGPLHGVPFVVKDNIDVEGVPTTAGCPGFAYLAAQDAEVVARLRAAGAVPVAKSNLDQFATGLVGTRSPYGTPANTVDATLVPGGSSSGSAVAVALGLVPFSLGTDTAGSGRVPAALNAIVGWKPSVGRASTRGIVPAVRRFDCPSVFARNVGDAALVAQCISGFDPADPFSRDDPPAFDRLVERVGVVLDWPPGTEPDDEIGEAYAATVQRLVSMSLEVVAVDPAPLFAAGDLLYAGPIVAERYVAVGDAITMGVDGLQPVVRSIIERSASLGAADAYRAEYRLAELRRATEALFTSIDALVLPTVPHALRLAEEALEPFASNERAGRYTTFVNLLDLAAVVVPVPGEDAPTFGAQLAGPHGSDDALGELAARLAGQTAVTPPPRHDRTTVVVLGAHLTGQPLNHQLTDLGARLVASTATTADYRLYALANTTPPKPGLVRVGAGTGGPIAVEVWELTHDALGRFLLGVPFPLALGTVELADGSAHVGFVAQPAALDGATDITHHGGWVAFLGGSDPALASAP